MVDIAMTQGRLTHAGGALQQFPNGKWEEEFTVANDIGFTAIELLIDGEYNPENPIWLEDGAEQIKVASEKAGIKTISMCIDPMMRSPITNPDEVLRKKSMENLNYVLQQCAKIGVTKVVLPFLEGGSLKDSPEKFVLAIEMLKSITPNTRKDNITLLIESDLPTSKLIEFVDTAGEGVAICHDTGNRASMGFPINEIGELGDRIEHVHIKDKDKGGANVMLGTGKVDFSKSLQALKNISYNGMFTLETFRGKDDPEEGRTNLLFIKDKLQEAGML
jgi:sugar phosphate isomerase/epimerase